MNWTGLQRAYGLIGRLPTHEEPVQKTPQLVEVVGLGEVNIPGEFDLRAFCDCWAAKDNDGYIVRQLGALPDPLSGCHNFRGITCDTDEKQIGLPGSCDYYSGFFVSR